MGSDSVVAAAPFAHLKLLVDLMLSDAGMQHKDAAAAAGVSKATWSVCASSNDPTLRQIEVLAAGLSLAPAAFIIALERARMDVGQWKV